MFCYVNSLSYKGQGKIHRKGKDTDEKLDNVVLVPEFDEQGVACYRLEGGDYENEYYVISEAESRKLLNTPEVVGYEVYH